MRPPRPRFHHILRFLRAADVFHRSPQAPGVPAGRLASGPASTDHLDSLFPCAVRHPFRGRTQVRQGPVASLPASASCPTEKLSFQTRLAVSTAPLDGNRRRIARRTSPLRGSSRPSDRSVAAFTGEQMHAPISSRHCSSHV